MSYGRLAAGLAVMLIGLAFAAAWITQDNGSMSLVPPASDADASPAADVTDPYVLHAAAYTAWAALLLVIPAFIAFPFSDASHRNREIWLAFWSAGYAAFFVHMLYSMGVFFGWDFDWMRNTSRVSAYWPGIVVLFWWPIDLVLAWRGARGGVVRGQRIALTGVLFVLFVGGSAVMGELTLVRLLGLALFVAMIAALGMRYVRRSTA